MHQSYFVYENAKKQVQLGGQEGVGRFLHLSLQRFGPHTSYTMNKPAQEFSS